MSSSSSSDKDKDSHAHGFFSGLAAFSSGDAHNGCRALFNGTAGWAYFGPTGFIEPGALPPGTESSPCDLKGKGKGKGRGKRTATGPPARPGEGLGRKFNDVRSVYLDAEDLRHLVRGTSEAEAGEDSRGDGAEGGGSAAAATSRKGRPIVLTLQAILAATSSPASPAAAAIEAAAARAEDLCCADATSGNDTRRRCPPESSGSSPPPPVAIADRAQFPSLLLRGASADKGPGLFLAPPITMVKTGAEQAGAEAGGAATAQSGAADGGGGGRVSCSEALAATSVAEVAEAAAHGGGMSRIGWWLRWATAPIAGADNAGAASTDGCRAEVAAAAAGGGVVSLETSNGADGWQVVSAPVPAAPPADAAAVVTSDDEEGSWCDFVAEGGEEVDVDEIHGPAGPLIVGDAAATAVGGGEGAAAATGAIEEALKRAAVGTIYGDGGSSFADEDETFRDENNCGADNDGGGGGVPQVVSPNVPRSFRDTLMAPSATGAVKFSDSRALLRARASAASSSPKLVDGGADGGAVFLWRKAAAGEAGRPDRVEEPVEDEDPYYARKRVGAFAFKTKPRGKAHK